MFKWFGNIIKTIGTFLKPVVRVFSSLSGLFFAITGRLGELIVGIDKFNKKTGIMGGLVHGVASALDILGTIVSGLANAFKNVISGFGEGFGKRMNYVSEVAAKASEAFGKLRDSIVNKFPQLKSITDKVATVSTST